MIEFVLLFALGFLAAVILGLLAAPVVQRRIVRFAEDRLKATMPLSPQEVRAQKDAARAGYAAETARALQNLKHERDKSVSLMLSNETLLRQGQKIGGENADLHMQLADMNVEAGDLRSIVRQLEKNIERLKTTLATVEHDNGSKTAEIKVLTRQLDAVSADVDSLRIDVAARTTEAENLKSRIAGLRDERETLRQDLKKNDVRSKDTGARLAREEARIRQLESRLAREMAANADKDTVLERRAAEIERLKLKIKDTGNELRDATRALRTAGVTLPPRKEKTVVAAAALKDVIALPSPPETGEPAVTDPQPMNDRDETSLADDARNRASALSDRLIQAKDADQDDALRAEMAEIAAGMVAVTLGKEGATSPIPGLLARAEPRPEGAPKALVDRIRDKMARQER